MIFVLALASSVSALLLPTNVPLRVRGVLNPLPSLKMALSAASVPAMHDCSNVSPLGMAIDSKADLVSIEQGDRLEIVGLSWSALTLYLITLRFILIGILRKGARGQRGRSCIRWRGPQKQLVFSKSRGIDSRNIILIQRNVLGAGNCTFY